MSMLRVNSFTVSLDGYGAGRDQSLQRGPWPDDSWKGWWGTTPPYHVPVFVLTHHPRESIEMDGGTTFHFVSEGIFECTRHAGTAAAMHVVLTKRDAPRA